MIGVVDYNAGNIRSVERALSFLNIPYIVSKKPEQLNNVDRVIFPGVGDAAFAMKELKKSGFDSFLKDFTNSGKPLLGICLGSQVIFDWSEEGDTQCLGLVKGSIKHFSTVFSNTGCKEACSNLKIPHMGWNSIRYSQVEGDTNNSVLFENIPENTNFYFVHSYLIQPDDNKVVLGWADYGIPVPAAIKYKNIYAVQFHPEKSAEYGQTLLRNFSQL